MKQGFTLAELLIALLILGVIATFTIPKVLQSQQDTRNKTIIKEAAAMLSVAHQQLKLQGNLTSTTSMNDMTPFFNYVRVDTVTVIDSVHTANTQVCNVDSAGPTYCLYLHNGAAMKVSSVSFGGTAATNAVFVTVDPDGKVTDGTTNGPGKSIQFHLYYDGRLKSRGVLLPNTCNSFECNNAVPAWDPPWFSWN